MRSFFLLRLKLDRLRFLSTSAKILTLFLILGGIFGFQLNAQASNHTYSNAEMLLLDLAEGGGIRDFFSGERGQVVERDPISGEATYLGARGANVGQRARNAVVATVREELGLPPSGAGSITDALTARLIGFLAFVMGIIVSFLGKLISLIINILLGFLTYNGFADAPPVIIGWKIVRDLVNMFFIVILILSSYATILGWKKELHVKDVLPKVLLAAVLVNFSKTIVALLIDASQVVMLTFVNAFAAIGAGNFTNALHLPLIAGSGYASQLEASVTSTAQGVAAAGAGQVIVDVLIASALQIFLLVIAIGVILMMTIFVLARIVGLWMLLIFSPVAFLTSALPAEMKKMLGPQVDQFWSKLSGLLTGGPVMAFFLWLTFATLSAQGANESLGLFNDQTDMGGTDAFQVTQTGVSTFITMIGNTKGLGSYMIAVAMMLMGLEAAMSAASSVGDSAGGLMKKIGDKSKKYASRAALLAGGGGVALAGGALAYGAYKGGRATVGAAAGLVDRRYDLRGKVAGSIRRNVPFAGGSEWLRKQETMNRDLAKKRAAARLEILNDPTATDDQKNAERARIAREFGLTGDPASRRVLVDDRMKRAADEKAFDKELKPMKDGVKAGVEASTDKVTGKRVSDRAGKQQSNSSRLSEYEKANLLIEGKSQEAIEKRQLIDDATKKILKEDPHLITNEAERNKQMGEVRQNFKSLSEDARGNFEVLKNFGADGAFRTDDASGKVTIGDAAAIRATRKKLQGNDQKNFDAMVNYVKESNGGVDAKSLGRLSAEQDANGQNRIFQADVDTKTGNITGGNFVISEKRQAKVNEAVTNFSAGNKATWYDTESVGPFHDQPTVQATQASALASAAKTVGVSQAVGSVGRGATGDTAKEMRAAAVHSIAKSASASIDATNSYLKQPAAANGDTGGYEMAGKTNADVLSDKKAPANVKDRIRSEYQDKVAEVLPMLNGVEELDTEEQIKFMSAMGQSNVGQALNSGIVNPSMKAATQQVKLNVVNANAEHIEEYFSGMDTQARQDYDDFKQYTEYEKKMNNPANPTGAQQLRDMGVLESDDAAGRQAVFTTKPELERQYNEYVSSKNAEARVKPKAAANNVKFGADYAKYVTYTNARSAVSQFNSNGGKGSPSTDRTRTPRPPRPPRPPTP